LDLTMPSPPGSTGPATPSHLAPTGDQAEVFAGEADDEDEVFAAEESMVMDMEDVLGGESVVLDAESMRMVVRTTGAGHVPSEAEEALDLRHAQNPEVRSAHAPAIAPEDETTGQMERKALPRPPAPVPSPGEMTSSPATEPAASPVSTQASAPPTPLPAPPELPPAPAEVPATASHRAPAEGPAAAFLRLAPEPPAIAAGAAEASAEAAIETAEEPEAEAEEAFAAEEEETEEQAGVMLAAPADASPVEPVSPVEAPQLAEASAATGPTVKGDESGVLAALSQVSDGPALTQASTPRASDTLAPVPPLAARATAQPEHAPPPAAAPPPARTSVEEGITHAEDASVSLQASQTTQRVTPSGRSRRADARRPKGKPVPFSTETSEIRIDEILAELDRTQERDIPGLPRPEKFTREEAVARLRQETPTPSAAEGPGLRPELPEWEGRPTARRDSSHSHDDDTTDVGQESIRTSTGRVRGNTTTRLEIAVGVGDGTRTVRLDATSDEAGTRVLTPSIHPPLNVRASSPLLSVLEAPRPVPAQAISPRQFVLGFMIGIGLLAAGFMMGVAWERTQHAPASVTEQARLPGRP